MLAFVESQLITASVSGILALGSPLIELISVEVSMYFMVVSLFSCRRFGPNFAIC
jgi:hypothetical protein